MDDSSEREPATKGPEGPAEYKVGYKRPPLHSRYREGDGRVRPGRPKGQLNLKTLLRERLFGRVTIKEEGKPRKVSRLEAIVAQEVNAAMQGKGKGFERITVLMRAAGLLSEEPVDAKAEPLSPEEQAIIDRFMAGQKKHRP